MHIREKDKDAIVTLTQKIFNEPLELWAYGSRVTGESHDMSDLDLVLVSKNEEKIEIGKFIDFKEALQNSNIPMLTQVLDWQRIPESFHKNILSSYVSLVKISE